MATPQTPPRGSRPFFPDVAEGLVWPLILKAPRLALRPARLGMSLLFVVLLGLALRIPNLWTDSAKGIANSLAVKLPKVADQFVGAVKDASVLKLVDALRALFAVLPRELWNEQRWYSVLAVVVPAVVLWSLLGGAVARSAAEDSVGGERKSWTAYLGFAIERRFALPMTYLGPLGLVVIAGVLVSAVGLLLAVPFVQIVAAAGSVVGLLVSLMATLLLLGVCLSSPMLAPAVVCEGTDAIDANQRALAYVFGRPLRYFAYLALFVAVMVVCTQVVGYVVERSLDMAVGLMTAWVGDSSRGYLHYTMLQGEAPLSAGDASWSLKATGGVLAFVAGFWKLLVPAYAFSLFHSGGAMLYLVSRFANDGQEPGELWKGSTVPEVLRKAGIDASKAAPDEL